MNGQFVRWLKRTAVGLAVGLFTAGCAGTGTTYVSHTESGTYFKLPATWTVFAPEDVLARERVVFPRRTALLEQIVWAVAFDADPQPSLDHVFLFNGLDNLTGYPTGYARTRLLEGAERDQHSLRSLRNEVIAVDEVLAEVDGARVVDSSEHNGEDGLRGGRMVLDLPLQDGGFFTYDQSALVDGATRTVYVLVVGCESECYERHAEEITEVVDSWTIVQER